MSWRSWPEPTHGTTLALAGQDGVREWPLDVRMEVTQYLASSDAGTVSDPGERFLQWLSDRGLAECGAEGRWAFTPDGAHRARGIWRFNVAPSLCLAVTRAPSASSTRWELIRNLQRCGWTFNYCYSTRLVAELEVPHEAGRSAKWWWVKLKKDKPVELSCFAAIFAMLGLC